VESQLVALGLLDARAPLATSMGSSPARGSGTEGLLPVAKAVRIEIQRVSQVLVSFMERAHGLRIEVSPRGVPKPAHCMQNAIP
jgi:hypothetical protein